MDIPEVIFPGSQDRSQLQRRFDSSSGNVNTLNTNLANTGTAANMGVGNQNQAGPPGQGPPRPKVPNIYVKKPHRKQPALGLFLAKADPEDREDWRLKSGKLITIMSRSNTF